MKTRADFLRVQRGVRKSRSAVGLETCLTPEAIVTDDTIRLGFTATRKIGNAVARNRAKRRLRHAAAEILPLYGHTGHDYVLVARAATLTCTYAGLKDDIAKALDGAHSAAKKSGSPS